VDEIVRQAMAKWPQVPACYGWLALDARGNWYMRDEAAQAAGAFDSGVPQARGSLLRHDKLLAFIGRNYQADEQGRWYFQNGPQRVFVELEATPWVWRLQPDGQVFSHTGLNAHVLGAELDEDGRLYLRTDLGFGLVHSQDVPLAAQWIEQGRWAAPLPVRAAELPLRHHYVRSPQRDSAG
jgi:hypothetical protein